jgi:hypothetical protein
MGIDGIGLGALEQGLGEPVCLRRVDDSARVSGIMQLQGEGHPVGVRCL